MKVAEKNLERTESKSKPSSSSLSYRAARARAEHRKLRADLGPGESLPDGSTGTLRAVDGDTVVKIRATDEGIHATGCVADRKARSTARCLAHCYNHFDKLLDSLEKCVGRLNYLLTPVGGVDKVLRDAKACLKEALTLGSEATVGDVHRRAVELLWSPDPITAGRSVKTITGQLREEFGDELYEQAVKEGFKHG